jgi:hypothetical protein
MIFEVFDNVILIAGDAPDVFYCRKAVFLTQHNIPRTKPIFVFYEIEAGG